MTFSSFPLWSAGMAGFAIFSLAALVATPLVLAAVLAWMPADYFVREHPPSTGFMGQHPALRPVLKVAKNLLGLALMVLGAVMILTPGQGVLTLFVGLLLLDVPGKRALERRIICNRRISRAANKLRARLHRPPLDLPRCSPSAAAVSAT